MKTIRIQDNNIYSIKVIKKLLEHTNFTEEINNTEILGTDVDESTDPRLWINLDKVTKLSDETDFSEIKKTLTARFEKTVFKNLEFDDDGFLKNSVLGEFTPVFQITHFEDNLKDITEDVNTILNILKEYETKPATLATVQLKKEA